MPINLNPITDALAVLIAEDTFISGPYGVTIDGRASSNVDYSWQVAHGDLWVDAGGGAYIPNPPEVEGMAWLGSVSRYTFALQAALLPSSDHPTATMGIVYGYGVAPNSRFYGVVDDRLVVYRLDDSGTLMAEELYDIQYADLADGIQFTLGVVKDRWFTRLLFNNVVVLEVNDVGMYSDGITQLAGVYLANTGGRATGFSYSELTVEAQKARGEFLIPFYTVSENCAESAHTPIYCPAEVYSLFAMVDGVLDSDVRLDFYEDEVLVPALTVTLTPSSGSIAVDFTSSPVEIGNALGYLTMRLSTLDDNDYGVSANLEAIPRVLETHLNGIPFELQSFRLVQLGSSPLLVGLGGKWPRLNTAFVDEAEAAFVVPVGSVSLENTDLGLNGVAICNIQTGNFVACLHWDTPTNETDVWAGISFGCTALGQGYAAILNWDSGGIPTFQLVSISGLTFGSLIYQSGDLSGLHVGGDIMVGHCGSKLSISFRAAGLTDVVLAQFVTTLNLPGPYAGISGTVDLDGVTLEVYLGEPHAIIKGSMQSYDNFGADDMDAGDANMSTPYLLEHRELVTGVAEKYTWDGHIHSQNPITIGNLSISQFKTGTQGTNLQTLLLMPTGDAGGENVYHEYGLVKPLYLTLPETL